MKKALIITILLILSLSGCSRNVTHNGTAVQTDIDLSDDKAVNKSNKILIAYFSRYGNTAYEHVDATTSASIISENNKQYGTTEYFADLIRKAVGGDVYLIETADKYPADFDELRILNHKEMEEDYLPQLNLKDLHMDQYDTIFLGYPVWSSDVPQAVLSFLNEYSLTDKVIIPFCTHDGYGAGNSFHSIASTVHSNTVLNGLAIEATKVADAQNEVEN